MEAEEEILERTADDWIHLKDDKVQSLSTYPTHTPPFRFTFRRLYQQLELLYHEI